VAGGARLPNGCVDAFVGLAAHGYSRELIERFAIIARAGRLSVPSLEQLLAPDQGFTQRVARLGLKLNVSEDAIAALAREAHDRGQGGRGLAAIVDLVLSGLLTRNPPPDPLEVTRETILEALERI